MYYSSTKISTPFGFEKVNGQGDMSGLNQTVFSDDNASLNQ